MGNFYFAFSVDGVRELCMTKFLQLTFKLSMWILLVWHENSLPKFQLLATYFTGSYLNKKYNKLLFQLFDVTIWRIADTNTLLTCDLKRKK